MIPVLRQEAKCAAADSAKSNASSTEEVSSSESSHWIPVSLFFCPPRVRATFRAPLAMRPRHRATSNMLNGLPLLSRFFHVRKRKLFRRHALRFLAVAGRGSLILLLRLQTPE